MFFHVADSEFPEVKNTGGEHCISLALQQDRRHVLKTAAPARHNRHTDRFADAAGYLNVKASFRPVSVNTVEDDFSGAQRDGLPGPFNSAQSGWFATTVSKDLPAIRRDFFGVDGDNDALAAKLFRALADKFGPGESRRINAGFVGPGSQHRVHVFDRSNAAADRQGHETFIGRALYDINHGGTTMGAGSDVKKNHFIGALLIVANGQGDGIPNIAQFTGFGFAELHAAGNVAVHGRPDMGLLASPAYQRCSQSSTIVAKENLFVFPRSRGCDKMAEVRIGVGNEAKPGKLQNPWFEMYLNNRCQRSLSCWRLSVVTQLKTRFDRRFQGSVVRAALLMLLARPIGMTALGQEAIRMSMAGAAAAQGRSAAAGAPGFYNLEMGPTYWRFGSSLSLGYNDNVELEQAHPEGDFIYTPSVNAQMRWPLTELQTLNLGIGAGYSGYVSHSSLNTFFLTPNSGVSFDVYAGDFVINLHDRVSITQGSYQDPTVTGNGAYSQFQNSVGVLTTWDLNKLVVNVGYDHANDIELTGGLGQPSQSSEIFSASTGFTLKPAMLLDRSRRRSIALLHYDHQLSVHTGDPVERRPLF